MGSILSESCMVSENFVSQYFKKSNSEISFHTYINTHDQKDQIIDKFQF